MQESNVYNEKTHGRFLKDLVDDLIRKYKIYIFTILYMAKSIINTQGIVGVGGVRVVLRLWRESGLIPLDIWTHLIGNATQHGILHVPILKELTVFTE